MKQYIAPLQLRIIGKGWEVRRQLSALAASSGANSLVSECTAARPPMIVKLGLADRRPATVKPAD